MTTLGARSSSPAVHARRLIRCAHAALAFAGLLTLLVLDAQAARAQHPPMPEHPQLREGFLAWDRGDYPLALRAYLGVLEGPDGATHLEEIALLTGELYRVTEVAPNGAGVTVAPDGRTGAFRASEGGRVVTKLVDLARGAVTHTVDAERVTLGTGGRVAYMRGEATLVVGPPGAGADIAVGDLVVGSLAFAPTGEGPFLLAHRRDASGDVGIYEAVDGRVAPLLVSSGLKSSLIPIAGGRRFVFEGPEGVAVLDRDGGRVFFGAAVQPSVSRDGGTLAFLRVESGRVQVESATLPNGSLGVRPESRVLVATQRPLANAVVSPDGRWVAYQERVVDDWEVFAARADGSEVRQLSLEIQHDRGPVWVGAEKVLAAKGEGRHMRSFLYDVRGGPPLKLFHNNSVRTIAPEYEWAATPDGSRILIVSDRDGDTVSPERGVYLVDLGTRVAAAEVRERLLEGLAAEEDLRERGRSAFAPVADVVTPVAHGVSVARIFQYARDVYALGSKYITEPGNALAIDYYVEALRSFGYEPELQWFEPQPGVRTANVIARIPGTVDPDLVYVVSSHFDSEEESPGADDNSSGSTALLEIARLLAERPMPATIELAFFTGEEAGLLGSREYVRLAIADGKHIVGALNNDMVGWANDHRLDNTVRYSNPGIRDIQHAAAMQFSRLITYDSRYYQRTDAAAYYEAYGDIVGGIGSYPVLGNPHYHQSTDRIETLNHELVAEVARTTVATVMLLASSPARVTGLEVGGGSARWEASPETGVRAYQVRWQTANGWASAEVSEPRASLAGLARGGAVEVRALHERGTVGWDWARATAPR
jgi:hypothetical protein